MDQFLPPGGGDQRGCPRPPGGGSLAVRHRLRMRQGRGSLPWCETMRGCRSPSPLPSALGPRPALQMRDDRSPPAMRGDRPEPEPEPDASTERSLPVAPLRRRRRKEIDHAGAPRPALGQETTRRNRYHPKYLSDVLLRNPNMRPIGQSLGLMT